jgi:hypothetical protein
MGTESFVSLEPRVGDVDGATKLTFKAGVPFGLKAAFTSEQVELTRRHGSGKVIGGSVAGVSAVGVLGDKAVGFGFSDGIEIAAMVGFPIVWPLDRGSGAVGDSVVSNASKPIAGVGEIVGSFDRFTLTSLGSPVFGNSERLELGAPIDPKLGMSEGTAIGILDGV